ncbi:XRE family transcriptional regulator [Butyrivibrio sp. CB08]|uniref:helix-turn-helix domain-containing protein n=1 Tax=Butyrivibrio sp. CB08 TaxID=2364879 RepID=UPI000EAA8BAF|nr:helix-turn-helix transcriptional regulator [Butyrivibrio sp. CB08]RKM56799.1 XRE family transcriptional regulator [Butyrivibrio sp. CB08]
MKKKTQKAAKKPKVRRQIDIDVGDRLRSKRKELKLTQEKMAEGLGKSVQSYANYEKGVTRIPFEVLVDLVLNYKISVDELLLGIKLEELLENHIHTVSDFRLTMYGKLISDEMSRRYLEKNK